MKNTVELPLTGVAEGRPTIECVNLKSKNGNLVMAAPDEENVTTVYEQTLSELMANRPVVQSPPDIFLRCVSAGTATETIGSLRLTDTDFTPTASRLSAKGLSTLNAALTDAYERLDERVRAAGCQFQPFVGRLHILDSSGTRIYSSPPQIIDCGGWQCCQLTTLSCSKDGTTLVTPAATLTVNMMRIEAVVESLGSYADRASAILVTVTPQLHPVDFSADAAVRLTRTDTTSPAITFALPGCTDSFSDRKQRRANQLKSLIPRLSACELQLATIPTTPDTYALTSVSSASARGEISAVAAALKTGVRRDTSLGGAILREISSPNGFRGETVAVSGDSVAWGDIMVLKAPPAIPRHHSTATGNVGSWEGVVKITFADGTTAMHSVGSPRPLPELLPALVSLPYSNANRLELWTSRNGTVRYGMVELSPSADGATSISLNTDLQPTTLSLWSGSMPEVNETHASKRYPGVIVTANTLHPYMAISAIYLTTDPVTALHPAVKSTSSWDFTRSHLYAFSPAGIFTVAFGNAKTNPASALIDPRGVSDGKRTAYTTTCVMALTDSGRLLALRGARTYSVVDHLAADRLEWFIPADELLIRNGSETLALDLANSQLHELKPDKADALTMVKWLARTEFSKLSRVKKLRIAMQAAEFHGTVRLKGDSGAGIASARLLLSLRINGQINAPVVSRVLAHPCSFVSLEIDGYATGDITITSANLYL